MSTLYVIWIATEDDGKPSTRRLLFEATTNPKRAHDAAKTIGGTITVHEEFTPGQFGTRGDNV